MSRVVEVKMKVSPSQLTGLIDGIKSVKVLEDSVLENERSSAGKVQDLTLFHFSVGAYVRSQFVKTRVQQDGEVTFTVDLDGWPRYKQDSTWPWADAVIVEHVWSHVREIPLAVMNDSLDSETTFMFAKDLLRVVDSATMEVK